MTNLPEPNFIERDPDKITAEWIKLYEEKSGKTCLAFCSTPSSRSLYSADAELALTISALLQARCLRQTPPYTKSASACSNRTVND